MGALQVSSNAIHGVGGLPCCCCFELLLMFLLSSSLSLLPSSLFFTC